MNKVCVAAMAAAAFCAGPACAETFSLNEALGVTYSTSPQLESAQAQLRGTDEGVAIANAGWRPTINANGSYGPENYTLSGFGTIPDHPLQGQITITQPLFRGGRTIAEISRAKALVRAGRAQLTAMEQTVLLNAVTAYMNVVRDQATVDLRQNNVDLLKAQDKATNEQYTVGELTRTDTSQARARLSGAISDMTTAQGQLESDRATFKQIIGRMPEKLESLPALPKLPTTQDGAIAIAQQLNPAMVQAKENERAANYAVDDAIGALMPTVSLQGQYFFNKSTLNSFGVGPDVGAATETAEAVLGTVNVPIYQGGAEDAQVRQAKEQHAQAEFDVQTAGRNVEQAVATAWNTYQSAQGAIASNQAQEKSDEVAYEGVKKEQQVGGRTTLDVLNAAQELLNSQVAVVSSQRDTVVAAYQLLAAQGQLTAANLSLHVKLYDPKVHYDDDASRWIGLGD